MQGGSHSRLHLLKKTHRSSGGFTVVETLIVLAVTGLLFASAVLLINGKQRTTAYNQSIRSVQTQLQQVVNDVGSGFYQNDGNLKCTTGGPGGGPLLTKTGGPEQGANKDCIFLGKVIQFGVHGTDPEEFNVYTMVGLAGDSANPSIDLASAKARLIANANSETGIPDAFDVQKLQYGLTVSRKYYLNNPTKKVGAVGFSSNLNSLGNANGSQQVNILAIPPVGASGLDLDGATAVTNINGKLVSLASANINPPSGVSICFNSGGTQQSGLITIGGNSRQGLITTKIYGSLDCM